MEHVPPLGAAEEASSEQLLLAHGQGQALHAALQAMDVEATSGVVARRAGDYEVLVAVSAAEGVWQPRGGTLEWRNPEQENCHVGVCVRDRADGRFVPGLQVTVTLICPDGGVLDTHEHPFLWHPWLYHYGRNWHVPDAGAYGIRVRIDPPSFMRHDRVNGFRYLDPIEVEFESVEVEPGAKKAR
jgi:hypothetical protein